MLNVVVPFCQQCRLQDLPCVNATLISFQQVEEYKQVNLKESHDLADAFLAYPFLDAQYRFLKSKGKSQTAAVFWFLKTSRPIWSKFL